MVSRTKKVKQAVKKQSQSNKKEKEDKTREGGITSGNNENPPNPTILPEQPEFPLSPHQDLDNPPPFPFLGRNLIHSKNRQARTEYFDFTVTREDDADIYKVNAPSTLIKLLETQSREHENRQRIEGGSHIHQGDHIGGIFSQDDVELMQFIGRDLDRSMSFEDIISAPSSKTYIDSKGRKKRLSQPSQHPSPKKWPNMSPAILKEIRRLPSWLQSMVLYKYPTIHAHYKEDTVKFFKAIANRIDKKYPPPIKPIDTDDPLSAPLREGGELDYFKENEDDVVVHGDDQHHPRYTDSALALRIAHAADRWRKMATVHQTKHPTDWSPKYISKANLKLRAALQTRARHEDIQTVEKDEEMLNVDHQEQESDEDEFIMRRGKRDYWNDVFDNDKVTAEAEKRVEQDLAPAHHHHQDKTKNKNNKKVKVKGKEITSESKKEEEKKKETKIKEKVINNNNNNTYQNINKKKKKKRGRCNIFLTKHDKRKKKRKLLTRGYFRDQSHLFQKDCGKLLQTPKRLTRKYRWDDSFHKYSVALVTSLYFKIFIMIIIAINSIVLAFETDSIEDFEVGKRELFIFDVVDQIFVSIYLAEFIVKVYAFPFRYWKSGFNIFDFIILVLSLIKNILDWTDLWDSDILRVFLIVRAMRILKGVSLSVQLQVLVSALIETIRTHVLSVVLLLVLLLYVISIIAFYLFGEQYPESFGNVPRGMLNMLRVLTIDGWTDLDEGLSKVVPVKGTIFLIICIVLGNFLFSNIFVAIIILNISEATDKFREKQREQRETVVRLKKEKVFQRQKLDLRRLFNKQKTSAYTDFFAVGEQFQKLLRHDDLVAVKDVICSPLWIDSLHQTMLRSNHTSSVLMNLHREMADNLMELHRHYSESHHHQIAIRRARYNRYLKMKAKLALIKEKILEDKMKLLGEGKQKSRMIFPDDNNEPTD